MSRAIAPRVEQYVSPSAWGVEADGQPRKMFNYGDGLVAVLVPGRKGSEKREIYRFRYCINGRSSTLHIGDGGQENFEGARKFSDSENTKIKQDRAQNSSLEERAKRIGKQQKSRKKERSDRGFKNRNDLIRFVAHLERQVSSSEIALLTILHISTLLDIWQLWKLKYEDLNRNGNWMAISICLDSRNKKAKYKFILPNFSRNCFSKFLSNNKSTEPDDYIFSDLIGKSNENLQELIGIEIYRAGMAYPVEINSLRNEFIKEFSEHGLIDKSVLEKFFGFKNLLTNIKLLEDSKNYVYETNYCTSTESVTRFILEKWDQGLFPFGHI
jgi:hypothetical protein